MKKHYYNEYITEICDNKHLNVDEIYGIVKVKFPEAWKSSIYRNVENLVKKWELKKVEWIGKKSYFEKAKNEHIHLIDVDSWKIIDIDIENELLFKNLPKNFKLESIDIKIFGKFE